MDVVAIIGAATGHFRRNYGHRPNRHQKVLAYSTISQLGYMFLALGVGAFAAGIFHLMTHAFFQALLFLGGRQRDALAFRPTGHPQNGRVAICHPGNLSSFHNCDAGYNRCSRPLWLLQQKTKFLVMPSNRHLMVDRYPRPLGRRPCHRWPHIVLHVSSALRDFYGMSRIPVEAEGHIHESRRP